MLIALQLLAALVLVVIASDAFTNAVEWVGAIFGLTRSAVGAVVAAIGSSLPETMVAVVALLYLRDAQSQAVGIGAVLGAPFMLSTLVFFLIGLTALMRKDAQRVHAPVADTLFGAALFLLTFALAIGASFAHQRFMHVIAAGLVLASYGVYLTYHLRRHGVEAEETPPPLRLSPRHAVPRKRVIGLQLLVALIVTVFASRWFVGSVAHAADALRLSPFLISLVLAPIATELPDASNVVLWMRRRQDELAVGNVIGALMFQTSIACAIGMLATPWQLGISAYVPSALALLSALLLVVSLLVRRRIDPVILLSGGFLYAGYLVYAIVARSNS